MVGDVAHCSRCETVNHDLMLSLCSGTRSHTIVGASFITRHVLFVMFPKLFFMASLVLPINNLKLGNGRTMSSC